MRDCSILHDVSRLKNGLEEYERHLTGQRFRDASKKVDTNRGIEKARTTKSVDAVIASYDNDRLKLR